MEIILIKCSSSYPRLSELYAMRLKRQKNKIKQYHRVRSRRLDTVRKRNLNLLRVVPYISDKMHL